METRGNREETDVTLRAPRIEDATAIYDLIRRSPPLDLNSLYCYLLLCDHFRNTCITAERESVIVGFISAYIPPEKPGTIFVWQVAVDESMRHRSLATTMLEALLERELLSRARCLETTVTPSNRASMAFFRSFAGKRDAAFSTEPCYSEELFGTEDHEAELLIRIDPLARP